MSFSSGESRFTPIVHDTVCGCHRVAASERSSRVPVLPTPLSGANSVEVFHIAPIPYSCEANFSVNGSVVTVSDVNNLALMGAARTCCAQELALGRT